MQRVTVVALSMLMLALSACGKNNADKPAVSNPAATAAAPVTSAAAESEASTSSAVEPASGEQVTETGAGESSDSAASQSLALRISESKPEPPSQWKEGTHYTRLIPTQPTNAPPGQIEVTEMFWYGCPHCYALDPFLEAWRKNGKAAYVSFVRVPVMWGAVHRAHARVFYTAEMLGKADELHTPIFDAIQKNHQPLTDPAGIEQFFTSHGVSAADFQKSFSSFAVEASLKRAETLGMRYKVDSVPMIVVNGKFVTDVGKAGGQAQLINLINELASREHGT